MKINVQNRLTNTMKVLLLLSVLCTGVLAEKGTVCAETSGDYEYTMLDDGTVEITKYIGRAKEVAIPNEIDGKVVTSIGNQAFRGCSGLTKISIPNCVTSIGASAFWGCSRITEISIPKSVTSIGRSAFYECSGLTGISIPSGVTDIGAYTFYDCRKLTKISIPSGVTSIGDDAFWKCSGLTEISIPNSVANIGNGAFSECDGLTEISIPNSVESIGDGAFSKCSGLMEISIPDSVTDIGLLIFSYCSGLKKIVVSEDNKVFDSRDDCNAIINTKSDELVAGCNATIIPNSVTSIGEYAFYGCTGLTEVTIPNGVTKIKKYAFYGCSGLMEITIPANVTYIERNIFSYCSELKKLVVSEENKIFDSRDNCSAVIRTKTNELIAGCKATSIPDGITIIESRAFYGCSGLTEISIPNSVTSIGTWAFYDCSGLTEISIPNSVTSIDTQAFYRCSGLTKLSIPDSVTSIGSSAFMDCSSLTEINIPNSVTSIEMQTFLNCTGLTKISIPDSVTSIGERAFQGCGGLTKISIPDSVTSISSNAFVACNPDIIFLVKDDSYADTYVKEHELNYIYTPISISAGTLTLEPTSCEYDGTEQTPTVTVLLEEEALIEGTDYKVSYTDNTEIGTATVEVNGIGDYVGTLTATFAIKHTVHKYDNQESGAVAPTYRAKGKTATVKCSVCEEIKTESEVISELTFSVSYDGNGAITVKMEEQTGLSYLKGGNLTANTYVRDGYTFAGWNLAADGTGTAYGDGEDICKLIEAVEANKGTVVLYAQWKAVEEPAPEEPITPEEPTVNPEKEEVKQKAEESAEKSKEYIDSLDSLTEQEKEEHKAEIDKMMEDLNQEFGSTDDVSYINGKLEDFIASLNKKVKDAEEESKKQIELTSCIVSLETTTYQYTKKKIEPLTVVTYNGYLLLARKDYTVQYADNQYPGTASIVVKGLGERFIGSNKISFTIVPNDYQTKLNQLKKYTISNQAYTGKAIKKLQNVSLTDGDYTLEEGTDYDITYKNNVKVGTAKVTFRCKNNYSGTVTLSYKIIPNAPKGISRDKKVKNNIKIKWKKVKEAGGYKVYRSTNKKKGYKLVKTISNNKTLSYTDKKAKKGKTYYYKIVACKKVSGKTYESADSAIINAKR